ncbi:MAG: HAMP domain-containing histidine kinase [Alphaproteobacteria bacterium]|nr:HAMP domain-containing histidine kinase [Alphaproteobacteria bacterium]
MVPDTDSPSNDWPSLGGLFDLRWAGRVSVTRRILAVNIFALALLGASFFYLDSYRTRLLARAVRESDHEAIIVGAALDEAPFLAQNRAAMLNLARAAHARVRMIDHQGRVICDAWPDARSRYGYDNPGSEPWTIVAARELDRIVDTIVFAPSLTAFSDTLPSAPPTHSWAEVSYAPDRTPMITAIAPTRVGYVITTQNARDITQTVRDERFRLTLIILAVTIVSILLSLFLARTIALPLRRLARAAVRVRLGRERGVMVPRLEDRSDEIGMLARAVSDMSIALRERIDATETFAADVSHELKNPLASLRSAVDSLALVQATELRAQLIGIIRDDVRRLNRLISDISSLSRLDAEISRAPFILLDLNEFVRQYIDHRLARTPNDNKSQIQFIPGFGNTYIYGETAQLERVVDNLIDNALSFSPADCPVRIGVSNAGTSCLLWVEDEGPGVDQEERDLIFRRFHSTRMAQSGQNEQNASENATYHAGLGLAIVRTIVEAHGGTVHVTDHADGRPGTRFVVRFHAAEALH